MSPGIVRIASIAVALACTGCAQEQGRAGTHATDISSYSGVLTEAQDAAEAMYSDGAFQDALGEFVRISAAAREADEPAIEARALRFACLANRQLGDLDEARSRCTAALRVVDEHGLVGERVITLNALGLVAWQGSRNVEALEWFRQSRELAAAMNDSTGVIRATGNTGLVLVEFAEFEEARRAFDVMREGGRTLGLPAYEANALTNLGMLSVWTGHPLQAIEYLSEARRIYQSSDDVYYETNSIGQLATAWAALGEPARAQALIDTAMARAIELDQKQEIASNLEILASITRSTGDVPAALRLYAQARALNDSAGYRIESATVLRMEAELHLTLGDRGLAARKASAAIREHRLLDAPLEILRDALVLAEIDAAGNNLDAAFVRLDSVATLVARVQARLPRAEAALAWARLYERTGESEEVLRILDGASEDLNGIGYDLSWQADLHRSRAYAALGRIQDAIDAGRRAVRQAELVRERFDPGVPRASFLASRSEAYEQLVSVLLDHGETDKAFEVADAAHGRALLDHIAAVPEALERVPALTDEVSLVERVDRLAQSIAAMETLAPAERDRSTLDTLNSLLQRARLELSRSGERDATTDPGSAVAAGMIAAGTIRDALQRGELLIEYFVTDSSSIVFVIDRDQVHAIRLEAGTAELARRVRLMHNLMSDPASDETAVGVAAGLYSVIIAPLLELEMARDADRWFIVGHGPLSDLPFNALYDETRGRYLVQDRVPIVLPSAAGLALLRSRAIGPTVDRWAAVFAPEPAGLPASVAEANAVKQSLPRSSIWSGVSATEANLRAALEDGTPIVHVAAHGVLNGANPLTSRIEMAPSKAEGDGRLEMREVLTLRTDSWLVFLSACETGAGQAFSTSVTRSDDYAALAQVFLFAGARNVVATLWRIDDASAAALTARFYAHLPGLPPAEALALAQRDLLEDSQRSGPFHWAGYQITGADRLPQNERSASVH